MKVDVYKRQVKDNTNIDNNKNNDDDKNNKTISKEEAIDVYKRQYY